MEDAAASRPTSRVSPTGATDGAFALVLASQPGAGLTTSPSATSTPSPLWRRPDRGLRPTPNPVTAGDPVSPCVAGQCHLLEHRQCDLPAGRRPAARLPGRHWAAGSGRPQCRLRPTGTARACLRPATLSPLPDSGVGRARCRLRPTGSARPRPQSVTRSPLRVAGPRGRAPSVGQGLTVTAAPTPTRQATPVAPLRHPLSGPAGFRPSPLLSHPLSLASFPLPAPGRPLLLRPRA